jgi:sugar phosphate isomerase/epimerase
MKIGISSPAYALEPFETTIEAVSKHFTLWEIVADLEQLLPEIKSKFLELTPSYDLEYSVHAPFNDLNIAALNPELRGIAVNYLKRSIQTSVELGITVISFHPGHLCPSGVYANDKVLAANQKSIKELAQFVQDEDLDVKLALENMPLKFWTLGNTAEEILGMIDGLDLGICFDVGHAQIVGDMDKFLENVDKFYNVHIHDNSGRRDEHLVVGEGVVDVPRVVEALKMGYDGNLIIEANNLDEGLRSKEYLENII